MTMTYPRMRTERGAHLALAMACLWISALLTQGCGESAREELTVAVNGNSGLPAERSEYAGKLPERSDCTIDHCVTLGREVVLEMQGCPDGAAVSWSVRNPSGKEVRRGNDILYSFTPDEAGTWLVRADLEGSKIDHFLIVRREAAADPPVAEAPAVMPRLSGSSRTDAAGSLPRKAGGSGTSPTVAETPEVVETPPPSKPLVTDKARLEVKGDQVQLHGLADGDYRIFYTQNRVDKEQRVEVRRGVAVWPDRLEAGRRHEILLEEIERVSDGTRVALRLSLEYGKDAPPPPPPPKVEPRPDPKSSPKTSYVGKNEQAGRRSPSNAPDCAGNWVIRAEMHLEASALCRAEYGWLWADQAGDLVITLRGDEGPESITKRLSKGKNQITLGNLYPELGPGEKAVLVLEARGGCRIADLSACQPAAAADKPLRVKYQEGRVCLTDILVRY